MNRGLEPPGGTDYVEERRDGIMLIVIGGVPALYGEYVACEYIEENNLLDKPARTVLSLSRAMVRLDEVEIIEVCEEHHTQYEENGMPAVQTQGAFQTDVTGLYQIRFACSLDDFNALYLKGKKMWRDARRVQDERRRHAYRDEMIRGRR